MFGLLKIFRKSDKVQELQHTVEVLKRAIKIAIDRNQIRKCMRECPQIDCKTCKETEYKIAISQAERELDEIGSNSQT